MKTLTMFRFKTWLASLMAASFVVACSGDPIVEDANLDSLAQDIEVVEYNEQDLVDFTDNNEVAGGDVAADDVEVSAQKVVYFAFDDFTVPADFLPVLEAHSAFLVANPEIQVKIVGKADERGGDEYNLALGQKRAEAVRQALTTFGVSDDQLYAWSVGEEKPVCQEATEECWAENRQAEIVYPGQE